MSTAFDSLRGAGAMIGESNQRSWQELVDRFTDGGVRHGIARARAELKVRQVTATQVAKVLGHKLHCHEGAEKASPALEPKSAAAPKATRAAPAKSAADHEPHDDQVDVPPPVPSKGITAAVESISPGRAQAWLLKSQGNRELRRQHIEWLAAQMREGSWEVTGQAVVFAAGGRLLDGHHRLEAVKASGCTVSMLVVYGVPASAWGKLDCGVVRAVHDRLQLLESVRDNRRAIEILQNLRRIENGHRGKLTPETVRQDWEAIGPHVRAVLSCFPVTIKGLTRTPVLAALVRYHQRHGEEKAIELAAALLTGANLSSDSPALLLRNWLTIEITKDIGGQQAANEIYWRTVAVCKGHRDGKRFTSLMRATTWGTEGELPASAGGKVA